MSFVLFPIFTSMPIYSCLRIKLEIINSNREFYFCLHVTFENGHLHTQLSLSKGKKNTQLNEWKLMAWRRKYNMHGYRHNTSIQITKMATSKQNNGTNDKEGYLAFYIYLIIYFSTQFIVFYMYFFILVQEF